MEFTEKSNLRSYLNFVEKKTNVLLLQELKVDTIPHTCTTWVIDIVGLQFGLCIEYHGNISLCMDNRPYKKVSMLTFVIKCDIKICPFINDC